MKYFEGEEVLALKPNSEEYQKGTILSIRGDRYKVQFEEGTEHTVHVADIKTNRPSRSTTRSSTRVGKKSPSRNSPSRRSQTRRSPGRSPTTASKRTAIRSAKLAKISLPRIDLTNEKASEEKSVSTKSTTDDDTPTEAMPLQSRLKEIGPVTRRSTRLYSGTQKPESEYKLITMTKSTNRAVSLPLERRSQLQDFGIDGKERGYSVQRDEDLIKTLNYEEEVEFEPKVTEKRKKDIHLVSQPQEWGGWIGTLIMIFVSPVLIILPQLLCTKDQCKFGYPNLPRNLNAYINWKTFVIYAGYFFYVALVSIIPIGKVVDGQQSKSGRLEYRMNGFLCTILSIVIFMACIYKGINVHDYILDNFLQFSISGWLFGALWAICLYIKASRAPIANFNIHASTDSVIYNFWQGREVNPRFGRWDFKFNLFRTSMIALILINLAIVIKALEEVKGFNIENVNIAAILAASLEIIYSMDSLFLESSILTTFEIMHEGTGYMLCIGYMLYPFLPTITTKYILYQKQKFSYFYGFFLITFFIGYALYRISNSQKDEFRRNPLSPAVSHLETIPTGRGKKLLVSGLWGHVRHPNYLGDIIMWWSIGGLSLACDILPYYYPIFVVGLLAQRAIRDNERCKMRYGLAWEQYTSRVKYMILYRIF